MNARGYAFGRALLIGAAAEWLRMNGLDVSLAVYLANWVERLRWDSPAWVFVSRSGRIVGTGLAVYTQRRAP